MAKRFIETGIFRKRFIRSLKPKWKLFYLYLITECDHAGVFDYANLDIDGLLLGDEYTLEDIVNTFGDRVQEVDGKLFVPEFIQYQYGNTLNPKNKVHSSVLKRLNSLKIPWGSLGASKGLGSPCQGAKDKDKDKDKDMDMDMAQTATLKPQDQFSEFKTKINKLRPEWQSPAAWSYAEEQHLFNGAATQMAELGDDDWQMLEKYFAAYLDQAKAYWRPNSRSKFVESFADVWAGCQRWRGKSGNLKTKNSNQLF